MKQCLIGSKHSRLCEKGSTSGLDSEVGPVSWQRSLDRCEFCAQQPLI